MEGQQTELHAKILSSRVNALAKELDSALKHDKLADERLATLQSAIEDIHTNRKDRLKEIEDRYELDLAEQTRQIKLAEDVLAKKKEEREALLSYLNELNLLDSSWSDYRDFDWDSLERAAEGLHKPRPELLSEHQKAEQLNEYIQRGRAMINALDETLVAVDFNKDRVLKAVDVVKSLYNEWNELRVQQDKRIDKLRSDNERLNMLIRQCVATNEPLTECVTKNVQAKCHSFLNSESPAELMNGLKKFKSRQDRIIKLLQYKDNQLCRETNKLEVARDQTHDQLMFYQNLIASRRGSHVSALNNITGQTNINSHQHQQQQQQTQDVPQQQPPQIQSRVPATGA